MKFNCMIAAFAAVGLFSFAGSAEAGGLFGGCSSGGSCCSSPNVVWGACAPTSCDVCDTGCNSGCGGMMNGGLLKKLFSGCNRSSSCGCAEPACGAPAPCAAVGPACGAPAPCGGCEVVAPTCGAPTDCCSSPKRSRGGLLKKFFGGRKSSSCGCEPACGAPAPCEPACGAPAPCAPACGAPAPCGPTCGAPGPCGCS